MRFHENTPGNNAGTDHFACDIKERSDGWTVIEVHGDLDLRTAPNLKTKLFVAIARRSPHLLVDLTHVTFCDSSGLHVLTAANRRAHDQGGELILVGPSRQLRKVLTITGLDRVFPLYRTREAVPPR